MAVYFTFHAFLVNKWTPRDKGQGVRYKNFANDEPTTASDFQSSGAGSFSQLNESTGDSGFEGAVTQNLSIDLRTSDRNYQSTAAVDVGTGNSTQFRYPPRNLFDDV